jgi:hypothetical protein
VAAQALSRSTEALHLGSGPWHDEHFGAEEHRSIQVDDRQGVSLTEPIFLAQGCWKGQGPAPSDLDRRGRHTENQHISIPTSRACACAATSAPVFERF